MFQRTAIPLHIDTKRTRVIMQTYQPAGKFPNLKAENISYFLQFVTKYVLKTKFLEFSNEDCRERLKLKAHNKLNRIWMNDRTI